MNYEEMACSLLRQTVIQDKELKAWVSLITRDKDFQEEFREWMVSPGLAAYHRRVSHACYLLACQIVWLRREGRFDEKPLTEEIANFHLKMMEANKKAIRKANFLGWKLRWRKK